MLCGDQGSRETREGAGTVLLASSRSELTRAGCRREGAGWCSYRTSYPGGFSPTHAALSRKASSRNANHAESIPMDMWGPSKKTRPQESAKPFAQYAIPVLDGRCSRMVQQTYA